MKFKKGLIIICLIICLFAMASVSASDVDDNTTISEGNNGNDEGNLIDQKINTTVTSQDVEISKDDPIEIPVSVKDNESQSIDIEARNITVTENNKSLNFKYNNSIINVTDKLSVGNHSLIINYLGNDLYKNSNTSIILSIFGDMVIDAPSTIITDGETVEIPLVVSDGVRDYVVDASKLTLNLTCVDENGNTNSRLIDAFNIKNNTVRFLLDNLKFVSANVNVSYADGLISSKIVALKFATNITAKNVIFYYDETVSIPITVVNEGTILNIAANDLKVLENGKDIQFSFDNSVITITDKLAIGNHTLVIKYLGNDTFANATAKETVIITDGTTFLDLNRTINDNTNDSINLVNNYTFNSDVDAGFTMGIVISRPVTINGNGYTINADGKARIFKITSDNVVLENITFVNGNVADNGGAVYFSESGRIVNCNFTDNKVTDDESCGGAVYFYINAEVNVTNCSFTNNKAIKNGGAIYFDEGSTGRTINCNFTNNSASNRGGAVYFWNTGEVRNCNFMGNNATYYGGAVYFWNTGKVRNCNFTNNSASDWSGAIYMYSGNVENCNFVDNKATSYGGAIYFTSSGTVENCNFIGNNATYYGGAVCFWDTGEVKNCNFTNNSACYGGAIRFSSTGNVTNCNFTNNTASEDGGAIWMRSGNVENCNFTGNNATTGSAIYFYSTSATKTVSNSRFLNNRANAETLEVTNDNNITITFTGKDNLLNAIYSRNDDEVTFTNVTYWGANVIANTGSSAIKPSRSNKEAGQNITVGVVVNGELVFNDVKVTDENGMIVLDIIAGENYYISARHDTDSYYTGAEKTNSTMKFNVNVTSQTTNNKTVNITAKSNIYNEVMPGKLLFIVPNSDPINATYAGNGTWWAVYTFDDYGVYEVNATYTGLDNVTINNATITVNKADSTLTVGDIVFDYGGSSSTAVSFTGASGVNASVVGYPEAVVTVENNTITVSGLNVGTYILTVTTIADADHNNVTKNVTITVNKIKTQLTAKAVTTTYQINKNLVITLKDSTGKVLSGVKVTVDLNGIKTYTTDKNGQVKINVAKLVPKTYTAKVTFKGNAHYAKSSVNVKVTVNKVTTKITVKSVKTTYKVNKKLVIALKDSTGKALSGVKVNVKLKGTKTYTTNKKGQIKINVAKLVPKTYTAKVTFKGNAHYAKSSVNTKVTVKKAKPKIKAKNKAYKAANKNKKFKITLKDNKGKPIKKAKVRLIVKKIKKNAKKKTTKESKKNKRKNIVKTNKKGKATFKVQRNKKGKYMATVKFYKNKYYTKAVKKVKIKMK